ncbi:MAG: molybdopterin converting factor subunit 1 [Acetobacteraceae bacterium]
MAKILYFASLRERMGRAEEDFPLPAQVATIQDLIDCLRQRDPAADAAFAHPGLIRAAVNQDFATATTPVADADEIAFFPPVTGG